MSSELPSLLLSHVGMLVVLTSTKKLAQRLTVFRSPLVRNDDKLFQPVAVAVTGQCVVIEHRELLDDPDMMFGKSQNWIVDIHDQCPEDDDHIHRAAVDDVFIPQQRGGNDE